MNVLVTGASGFVGKSLCDELAAQGHLVRASTRLKSTNCESAAAAIESVVVGNIGAKTQWVEVLVDIDVVVHCAARAHVMQESNLDALSEYRSVNVDGSRRLLEQAAESGVKRLVYLSSIKVNGEKTEHDQRFSCDDQPKPEDPYGVSKWEAEQALQEISARTGLELVIIRPPLVFGPGVKGNFHSLLNWLHLGVPLPLGAIHNKRSMVALTNLVGLIVICINHPAAVDQTFLVSDDEDVSTTDLLRSVGIALGRPARLLPIPSKFLAIMAKALSKPREAQRLLGNLQLDISKTRDILDWSPSVSVEEELQKTAKWYLGKK